MNLNDLKLESEQLLSSLVDVDNYFINLKNIRDQFVVSIVEISCEIKNKGGTSNTSLVNEIRNSFNRVLKEFRGVDNFSIVRTLTILQYKYKNKELKTFVENYMSCSEIFVEVNTIENVTKSESIVKFIKTVDNIVSNYESLKKSLSCIVEVEDRLHLEEISSPFELRLMSEDNEIEDLLKELNVINKIYNNINTIIGSEEKLKYTRLESGSFLVKLVGNVITLKAMLPILEFIYKIYSEQFSKVAKQEQQLKELKVRKEILKFILEVKEVKYEDLEPSIKEEIQNILLDLETDIKELYSLCPYIKVNNKELGNKQLENQKINVSLLESAQINDEDLLNE